MNRVLKQLEEQVFSGCLMKLIRMLFLQNSFFLLQNKAYLRNERQTVITFGKSYSVMESIKSSYESQYLNVLNHEIEKERMDMVFASGNIIQGIL